MQFVDLSQNSEYLPAVESLYRSAFPDNERVPMRMLLVNAHRRCSDFYAVLDGDTFIGLLSLVYHRSLVFVWYIAVIDELRCQCYGTAILDEVKARFPDKRIILNLEEVTADCTEEQRRRKDFYLRNGFCETTIRTKEAGVVYEMLCSGGSLRYREYRALMIRYLGPIVYRHYYRLVSE